MQSETHAVDEYLAALEPATRTALSRIRKLVLETVLHLAESKKYRMPNYEYEAGVLSASASQKRYVSLHIEPTRAELLVRRKETGSFAQCPARP